MKRLIISSVFTFIIIVLYQFIDINLFTIDLPRRVSSELFKTLRNEPDAETGVVIFDIEYIPLDTVKLYLETLVAYQPKSIGVNLCNIKDKSPVLDQYLRQNRRIVTCDCQVGSKKGTSRITTDKNVVTHFKTDSDMYFEMRLTNQSNELKARDNAKERINFRRVELYSRIPLSEVEGISPDVIKGKILVVGFVRDSIVTPMNEWYGEAGIIHGDMSDAQISANIISTINRNDFINDVNLPIRILIVLSASLICTGLISLARTKSNLINIIVALATMLIINGLSAMLIVFAFSKNYYLELNEMTVVLIITAITAVYLNTRDKQLVANKS